MAFLELNDVGKIYATGDALAVGIRHVSLSFDRGEFVAVTGKSGSGKSTLLNVISGMDSYEEGEILVDGDSTLGYTQEAFEEFRKKYVAFVFQDYNVIDSFTVLQNVELALTHVDDAKERRRRALDLLEQVGLSRCLHQKASRLSGGQKQRTVIARALAKNAPILLCDEPTGNLDAETSKEIVTLLQKVSGDKLTIVVTHDAEEFDGVATRVVRLFDGGVESDTVLSAPSPVEEETSVAGTPKTTPVARFFVGLKNAFGLGRALFFARPKLAVFTVLLLLVGLFGIYGATAVLSETEADTTMFRHVDGRVVLIKRDGTLFTDDEITALSGKKGVVSVDRFDYLTDMELEVYGSPTASDPYGYAYYGIMGYPVTALDTTDGLVGRLPTADNEVVLSLPVSYQSTFGRDALIVSSVSVCDLNYNLVGVRYFTDNNQTSQILLTKEGYDTLGLITYYYNHNTCFYMEFSATDVYSDMTTLVYDFTVPVGTYRLAVTNDLTYDTFSLMINGEYHTDTVEIPADAVECVLTSYNAGVYVHPTTIYNLLKDAVSGQYKQLSLYYANDKTASSNLDALNGDGYLAVLSDVTCSPQMLVRLLNTLTTVFAFVRLVLVVVFCAFFIQLCLGRSQSVLRPDVAIMRSMGLTNREIKSGVYLRMFIALTFTLVLFAGLVVACNRIPALNGIFTTLYWWHYLVIVGGVVWLTVRLTKKQIKQLFGVSVKKALRGGELQ